MIQAHLQIRYGSGECIYDYVKGRLGDTQRVLTWSMLHLQCTKNGSCDIHVARSYEGERQR